LHIIMEQVQKTENKNLLKLKIMYNKGNNNMSYGSGMASNRNTPGNIMRTPGQMRMDGYAKGGGLKGYMKGGDVMDAYKTGGSK